MIAAAPRFRLDPHLPPGRALRALALAQLDYALARLARGNERDVHEARKACKRLRAVLRLARPGLSQYHRENARVRDAGRALAALRDADVRRATARSLGLALAADPRRAGQAQVRAATRRAARLLRIEHRAVADWPADVISRAALDRAFREGYRRARRDAQRARRKPQAPQLHEWRKQVKYHRYQCEGLARLWRPLTQRVAPLEELGEMLGRHHDLEVLALELRRRPHLLPPAAAPRAARRIRAEQERLARRALRYGAHLFAEGPRAWFARETVR